MSDINWPVKLLDALRVAPAADQATPAANPKIVHWLDFVRFITDQDMWSRWEFESMLDQDVEAYFVEHWNAAREKRTMQSFDFSKTSLQVYSRDSSTLSWEHDGETLWYFFQKFTEGKRV